MTEKCAFTFVQFSVKIITYKPISGESDRRKKSVYRYFDFGDDEDDDFNRRKKSLYMLPRMSWSPYDKKGNFKLLISTYKSASLLISS